jgi:hypothetical protein
MRIFYWCAFYGEEVYLRLMVRVRRWSPFIKSYLNRSAISGAITGNNSDTVRYLLGEYQYDIIHADQVKSFA